MDPFRMFRPGDPFGLGDGRGGIVLDARAAAELNAIRAELGRLGKVSVAPPLEYASDAAGRRWRITRPQSVYAKLTGTSGSAYTWGEATISASGVSSLVSGGRSGTAYEANGVTGLTGSYATLDWMPASGDWRFQAIRDGSVTSTPCLGISFPNTMYMRTSFTYPSSSACSFGKDGTTINTTWTFTKQTGTVFYFNGSGGKHSYTGNYWQSDLHQPQPDDYYQCINGFDCGTYRTYLILCDPLTGSPLLNYFPYSAAGDYPGSPWDRVSHSPCASDSLSDGSSLYHTLISHSTSPFQLNFGVVANFSDIVTDI